jgi:ribosomal protein S18 acetylase RimI-like enzyme
MSTPTTVVTRAGEIERLVAPLVLAFSTDVMVRWLLPEPRQFLQYFPRVVQVHANRVVEYGGAFHTTDFRGASLWYPPGVEIDGESLAEVLEQAVEPRRLEIIAALFSQTAAHKPAGHHWYLRQVGVDPQVQGQGYGSLLLRPALDACDRAGVPAFLEATNTANRRFYERFGFETVGELRIEDSPTLWLMTRGAQEPLHETPALSLEGEAGGRGPV